ncbi:MAG: hypothetical protein KY464_05220 [Gemmatimonadetes bacterium]|nr:hypothetical protein [Gemmatimonadota bacterium]
MSTFSSEVVGLDLDQAGSRITGRAELAPDGTRAAYQVKGILRGADFTLSLVPQGGGDAVAVSGAIRSDTLKIRIDGGGYHDRFVPLVRSD